MIFIMNLHRHQGISYFLNATPELGIIMKRIITEGTSAQMVFAVLSHSTLRTGTRFGPVTWHTADNERKRHTPPTPLERGANKEGPLKSTDDLEETLEAGAELPFHDARLLHLEK